MRASLRQVRGRASLCWLGTVMLLAAGQVAWPQQLLGPFETTDGLSLTWGQKMEGHLDLVQEPPFVTEGEKALRLWADVPEGLTGNQYLGVRIELAAPTDLRRGLILFDAASGTPEVTRALYLRAYDDQGRRALSLVNWAGPLSSTPRTFRLPCGASSRGFTWEPKEVPADADPARVIAIEFVIGTSDKGVRMDAYFDNLRVEETEMRPWSEVAQPKPLVRETPLVSEGRPAAVVVAPPGKEWEPQARAFIQAVADATGVELPLRRVPPLHELLAAGKLPTEGSDHSPDLDASLWGGAPVVLDGAPVTTVILGNVCDTAGLLYLYSRSYCAADHFYPGPGGYELRTVHDPWGRGLNALVLGCGDPAGAAAALAALKPLLAEHARPGDLSLRRLLRVHLTGEAERRYGRLIATDPGEKLVADEQAAAERALQTGAHTGLWGRVADIGQRYARTGYSAYARVFVWLVRRALEHYQSEPGTYGGPWGMDSDFTVYRVLPAWDVVEEDPSLTDEERWEVTRILHQWVSEVAVGPSRATLTGTVPRHNHQTFPALGLMYAGDYFGKYYHTWESDEWLAIADACFDRQARMFKPHEDCNGYQWLTLGHLAQYCLARPACAYFQPSPAWRGDQAIGAPALRRWGDVCNARRNADYALLSADSFGYSTTYGDTGAYVGWWSELTFLRLVNFVLRDPSYQWVIERKAQRSNRLTWGEYAVSMPASRPESLTGTLVFPLDGTWWTAHHGEDPTPFAVAADKVCLRDGYEDGSWYVLLDGLNPGGHRHFDGNSVSRWCANGRIWLADADYFRAEPQAHSTVIVLRDGLADALPSLGEAGHVADLPSLGATETILRGYNGVDWHRWLLWLKNGSMLVADRFVAQRAGDYSFRVYWQLLGDLDLGEHGVNLHQAGQYARLAFPADASLVATEDEAYGANWAGYPHIERPVVHVLRAIYDARLDEGQQFVAWTLLQATGPEAGSAALRRAGASAVVVSANGETEALAAGLASPPPVGPVTPAAAWCLAGARLMVTDADGRDLQADLGEGRTLVLAPAGRGPDPVQGRQERTRADLRVGAAAVREALGKMAGPAQAPAAPVEELPEEKPQWLLWPLPDSYTLTGNREPAGPTVDLLAEVTTDPQPLEANLFGGEAGRNRPENLFDGRLTGTGDCVMWAADQTVILTVSLSEEASLGELDLRAWWASSSSKNATFQIASIKAEVSSDGFRQDVRLAGQLTDEAQHENWGGAAHLPERYLLPLGGVRARQVRLTVVPRPGTAVYLSELYLRGTAGPLADGRAAARLTRGLDHFTCLAPLPDGGGVVGGRSDGGVWLVGPDGRPAWQQELAQPVLAIAIVRFDGQPAVVAGCREGLVAAFALDGTKLWEEEIERYKNAPHAGVVVAADFSGEGLETAVVGSNNWRYHAFDGSGNRVWHYESVHVSTAACVADLTGDGLDEAVLGTNYYWWHAVKADGTKLWSYSTRSGPECTAVAAGDLDGDGSPEVVFAAGDGSLQCVGAEGKPRWMVFLGDRATSLACTDVDEDGKAELLVGSANCLAYCLEDGGKVRWCVSAGQPIVAACLCGDRWVCCCRDGSLLLVRVSDGRPTARAQFTGKLLAACSFADRYYAATDLGELAAFGAPGR